MVHVVLLTSQAWRLPCSMPCCGWRRDTISTEGGPRARPEPRLWRVPRGGVGTSGGGGGGRWDGGGGAQAYFVFSVGNLMPVFQAGYPRCWVTQEVCSPALLSSIHYTQARPPPPINPSSRPPSG